MAGGDSESKTEKASPKKRKDERKKGNVFQSKDISTVFSIFLLFMALKFLIPFIYQQVAHLMNNMFLKISEIHTITVSVCMNILTDCVIAFFLVAGPIMLVSIIVSIISSGVQTRFIVSFESLKPKFSNMSILKGIKRMFSMRSVVELVKSMIKVVIIIAILYMDFMAIMGDFANTMAIDVSGGVLYILNAIMDMVIKIVLAFAALSMFDYMYQWWEYEKKLKMSKQEVKEEYKHMEGDPQIKGKIRERQRKMATQRMMQEVPTADVVIRNPTHYAIALRYDPDNDDAPIIVAKGQDFLALKIVEIAEQNGIPTTLNPPLARALYKIVEPNMPIPGQFYTAIAEIMAWVYELKNNKSAKAPAYSPID